MYTFAIIATLLSVTEAHMRMELPAPFGQLLSNRIPNLPHPLGKHSDYSDEVQFPCQSGPTGDYDFSKATSIAAGHSTLVSFIGEIIADQHTAAAVHGGGSCQFSLAKTPSTNPKDWKVIKTLIGGCPATAQGNIIPPWRHCSTPDSDEVECVKQYNVQIPKEVPSGKYFFAWTWFNKLGNREMYMQCAPIEVNGGGEDEDYLDTLPSLFMANCKGFCTTEYGGALGITNPGLNVIVSDYDLDKVADSVLVPCKATYGDASRAPNFPVKGSDGGKVPHIAQYKQAPATGSQGALVPSVPVLAPPPTVASPPLASSFSSAPSFPFPEPMTHTGSCAGRQLPCTGEGQLSCISDIEFGLCDRGCMVPQVVAAGTVCREGAIQHARAAKRGDAAGHNRGHHKHR